MVIDELEWNQCCCCWLGYVWSVYVHAMSRCRTERAALTFVARGPSIGPSPPSPRRRVSIAEYTFSDITLDVILAVGIGHPRGRTSRSPRVMDPRAAMAFRSPSYVLRTCEVRLSTFEGHADDRTRITKEYYAYLILYRTDASIATSM